MLFRSMVFSFTRNWERGGDGCGGDVPLFFFVLLGWWVDDKIVITEAID